MTQTAIPTKPAPARIWELAKAGIDKGAWLINDTALLEGTRCGREYRFTACHAAPRMLSRLLVPRGLDELIKRESSAFQPISEHADRLRRRSLYQIASWIRAEVTAGLGDPPGELGHHPPAASLLRQARALEATHRDELRTAVLARARALLERQLQDGSALVLLDGALHRARPERPILLRVFRSRRQHDPVSIPASKLEPMGCDLTALMRQLDATTTTILEAWRQQIAPEVHRLARQLMQHLAEDCGQADRWDGRPIPTFHRGPHHHISLMPDSVTVEKRNTQPWYVSSCQGTVYRFPGHRILLELTPLADISAVTVLQPRAHRYVGKSGSMCVPEAAHRMARWQRNQSLRLGQVVELVFRLHEDALRLGGVLNDDAGMRPFESLEAYRVAPGTELPPDAVFYPYDGRSRAPTRVAGNCDVHK